jgi:hypothetical protein
VNLELYIGIKVAVFVMILPHIISSSFDIDFTGLLLCLMLNPLVFR